MEIIEVDSKYYDEVFDNCYNIFNKAVFNEINSHKTEKVFYLIFKDPKTRLGIVLGAREEFLFSPFSAPFGGFQFFNEDIKLNQIDSALKLLQEWIEFNSFKGIKIVCPPIFYHTNFLTKLSNSFHRSEFKEITLDINYHFLTEKLDENYLMNIWHNARKNLKKGIKANLKFEKLHENEGEIAFNIIEENRKQRGFPLRMTWDQVKSTAKIIPADFFIVKKENENIAASVVFHVAEHVVQVIYWGDLPQYSGYKTMNFLSFELFKYYKEIGIRIVDIGPSTEDSVPNYGLCDFKESIGCDLSVKSTFKFCL